MGIVPSFDSKGFLGEKLKIWSIRPNYAQFRHFLHPGELAKVAHEIQRIEISGIQSVSLYLLFVTEKIRFFLY